MINSIIRYIRGRKKTILLIITVSALTLLLDAAISTWLSRFHNLRLPSLGTIRVVGAEAYGGDINLTQGWEKNIDWGTIYPGLPVNRSFYIRSESNVPVTLNISMINLTFLNSRGEDVTDRLPVRDPLSLTWNYSNTPLNPKEEIYVTLTIEASTDPQFLRFIIDYDVQEFRFDITIVAKEQ
jgi:hypothetical protein